VPSIVSQVTARPSIVPAQIGGGSGCAAAAEATASARRTAFGVVLLVAGVVLIELVRRS
jgi:MYXO-CTERM domain-containing protein